MMDQKKIGRFIAERRKEKELTQEQLSEKLNITSKAVSKWETGKNLPDASLMLDLSHILDITVNELLSGEKIDKEDVLDKAEENLIKISQTKEASIKATRYSYCFITIILFLLTTYHIFVYGIEDAIKKPEFYMVISTVFIFWLTYSIVINKNK